MEDPRVSLGPFEIDFHTGEVRKHGFLIKLQEKPLRVLQLLVEHPGCLVTRDELRQHLWPQDLYLDFDRNLTIAMNKLRTALNDSAEKPRYIETLPRRGYRLIASVEKSNGNGVHALPVANGLPLSATPPASEISAKSAAPAAFDGHAQPSQPFPALAEPSAQTLGRRSWLRWAAGFTVVALIALEFFLHPAWYSTRGDVDFHERDWVLISRFENRTGEPVLDGTVEYALARELSNSSFVGLAPAERVQDVLRMMKKPGETPLSPAIAREVCLRDGGIRALINGRVEKMGAIYVLSASVVNPSTDAQVAGISAEAHGSDAMLSAVRQLSNRLRETLGEKLPTIRETNAKLEQATTPSLRALQLYSQGMGALFAGQDSQSIPLFEEALREDPQFASAHVYLAHCYSNTGNSKLAERHFQEAYDLAGSTSDRERYFILGSYYERSVASRDKAIQAYEVLLRLHPDDYWGANNLAFEYRQAGRFEESMSMIERLAEMRPNNPAINYQVANRLFRTSVDFDRVRPFIQRARGISTEEMIKLDPSGVTTMA
ncbi:MAG: winged helix-turn-helix domain-containing protein, partial [Candidatus Acidiferrales bacterium]